MSEPAVSHNPLGTENCDYPGASISIVDGKCTCLVCARCQHHTGNSSQGHYWAHCKVTRTKREFHFCCPDNCELEVSDGTA